MNIPGIFVYGGSIKAGHYNGEALTVVSAFEAVGQYSAQHIGADQSLEVERRACPGAGSCGGMFTANTMSAAIEAMGLSLPFSSTMAAEDQEKAESAAESAGSGYTATMTANSPWRTLWQPFRRAPSTCRAPLMVMASDAGMRTSVP